MIIYYSLKAKGNLYDVAVIKTSAEVFLLISSVHIVLIFNIVSYCLIRKTAGVALSLALLLLLLLLYNNCDKQAFILVAGDIMTVEVFSSTSDLYGVVFIVTTKEDVLSLTTEFNSCDTVLTVTLLEDVALLARENVSSLLSPTVVAIACKAIPPVVLSSSSLYIYY